MGNRLTTIRTVCGTCMGACVEPSPSHSRITINCSCFHSTSNTDVKDDHKKEEGGEEKKTDIL